MVFIHLTWWTPHPLHIRSLLVSYSGGHRVFQQKLNRCKLVITILRWERSRSHDFPPLWTLGEVNNPIIVVFTWPRMADGNSASQIRHLTRCGHQVTRLVLSQLYGEKKAKVIVIQLCPTLGDLMDCTPPASSVHWILQAIILWWVAMPFSRWSFRPRDWAWISCIPGGFFTPEPPRKSS